MRILITNDDGINATQLVPFIKWCQKLGEVITVVPKYEQSGKSHSIELHKSIEAKEVELEPGIKAWAVDSSPADCVRFAVFGLNEKIDLVLSGINRGINIGVDVSYSGTVAAIFEAGLLGIPGVALSTEVPAYGQAVEQLDMILDIFKRHELMKLHSLYNVNIPAEVKGYRFTRQGGPHFSVEFLPQENNMYFPTGESIYQNQNNLELDGDAIFHGYISILPLSLVRSDMDVLEKLKELH